RVEEPSQRKCHDAGDQQAAEPEEHRQAVELVDLLDAELADGQHLRTQAKFGEQRDQPEVDRGHPHEAVVLWREQPGDDQPRYPAERLTGPLRRCGPDDTMQQRAVKGPSLDFHSGRRRVGECSCVTHNSTMQARARPARTGKGRATSRGPSDPLERTPVASAPRPWRPIASAPTGTRLAKLRSRYGAQTPRRPARMDEMTFVDDGRLR